MGGIAKPWIPLTLQSKTYSNTKTLSAKALSIINTERNFKPKNKTSDIDLVYIVKCSDINDDLKYSLRSVYKFCNYRKIWIIGYKPEWVQNVEYIETIQTGNKWQNSMLNWQTACEAKDISDNFILMNDDFIAIHPIYDIQRDINACLIPIDLMAKKYKNRKASRWQTGFILAQDLLTSLNLNTSFNMETHIPFIVNKKNYLDMLNLPQIKDFDQTKVLHKRTIYYNLYYDNLNPPRQIKDVKILLNRDLSDQFLNENWISVFDDVIGNSNKFPKINKFLEVMFPEKCIYEK